MTNDILGYVQSAVGAVLALAVLFGVDLSEDQIAGILAAIAAVGALAFAINTRTGKPAEIRAAARRAGVEV
jgi:uncharacterized protein (DUF697 family)